MRRIFEPILNALVAARGGARKKESKSSSHAAVHHWLAIEIPNSRFKIGAREVQLEISGHLTSTHWWARSELMQLR